MQNLMMKLPPAVTRKAGRVALLASKNSPEILFGAGVVGVVGTVVLACRATLKVSDVLEILSIPLLGIIPESEEVLRASNVGTPVTLSNPNSMPARAYFDAARRLRGESIEIAVPTERKGLLGKLFGRRAA